MKHKVFGILGACAALLLASSVQAAPVPPAPGVASALAALDLRQPPAAAGDAVEPAQYRRGERYRNHRRYRRYRNNRGYRRY